MISTFKHIYPNIIKFFSFIIHLSVFYYLLKFCYNLTKFLNIDLLILLIYQIFSLEKAYKNKDFQLFLLFFHCHIF